MKTTNFLTVMLVGVTVLHAADFTAIGNRDLLIKAQHLPTDDRIHLLEKNAGRGATAAQVALADALMQKLRETGDVGYLNRATKVIEPVLKTEPESIPAQRRLKRAWRRRPQIAHIDRAASDDEGGNTPPHSSRESRRPLGLRMRLHQSW